MLTVHQVSKSYNLHTVLKGVSFSINTGDRVGLIGPNGGGKTTLLRILAGQELPDSGVVTHTNPALRLAYLPQGFEFDPQKTLQEVFEEASGNPAKLEAELERLASALALHPDDAALQAAFDTCIKQMENLDPAAPAQAQSILEHLGLNDLPADLLAGQLSGGQKTRLSLAFVLLGRPNLLLLDEPTNHLDVEMLTWLEDWLQEFPGAALIVSHDRTFLDHTVDRILNLDSETHTLREYAGNYSAYLEQYLAEKARVEEAYQDQVYEIRRMQQDINRTKQQAAWVEQTTTPRQPGVRRYAKKVARKAKSREKKLERYQSSDERIEKPRQGWQMKLDFSDQPGTRHLGQDVLFLEDLSVGYAGRPPLLSGIDLQIQAGQRLVLTGSNGSGKTTLLRTIAGQIPPVSGQIRLGHSVRMGFMSQEQELLDPALNALESIQRVAQLNETETRSFLHFYLFTGDDPLRPTAQLSFGERARLSLAVLVAQGCNFLMLDEPINHLDIPSRSRFEQALVGFPGTVLAVVHDRYFIERFATHLWRVEAGGVRAI